MNKKGLIAFCIFLLLVAFGVSLLVYPKASKTLVVRVMNNTGYEVSNFSLHCESDIESAELKIANDKTPFPDNSARVYKVPFEVMVFCNAQGTKSDGKKINGGFGGGFFNSEKESEQILPLDNSFTNIN